MMQTALRFRPFTLALGVFLAASLFSQAPTADAAFGIKSNTTAKASQAEAKTEPTKGEKKTVLKSAKKGKSNPTEKPERTLSEEQITWAKQLGMGTKQELKRLYDALEYENKAVSNELADDEETAVTDIAMLWQAAVERSGTIRYAIEKLSRRDATGKPVAGDSVSRRMLQSLARIGGMAGAMVTGSPAGLVGGSMINEMLEADPTTDPSKIQITDADMLILAKEVETLQTQLLETYFNYRQARERWQLSREGTLTIGKHTTQATGVTPKTLEPLLESLYETAKQDEDNANRDYISSRNALGLMVGQDAVIALEKAIEDRTQSGGSKDKATTENPQTASQ